MKILKTKTYSLASITTTTMEKRESQARQKWKREIRKKKKGKVGEREGSQKMKI
jgi:hypothetical protein